VNSVAPGWIWAETLQNYFGYLARQRGVDAQVVYDEIAATIDLRRLHMALNIDSPFPTDAQAAAFARRSDCGSEMKCLTADSRMTHSVVDN